MDAELEGPTWDALRAEGAWMRRLARALVGDPQAADDLVQDAWRRVAERHGERRPTRAWMAGMLRFLARERRRSEARRMQREHDAARPEAQPPSDELEARLEVQQRVLDAVRALPVEQRDALLLRYYDELAPHEIARRLGVPAGTVRARLSRGLAELRRRLDERSGGDRSEWQLALLPWIASDVALRGGALALGGLAVKLGLAVGAAALALVVVYVAWPRDAVQRAPVAPSIASETELAQRSEPAKRVTPTSERSGVAAPADLEPGVLDAAPNAAPVSSRFAARVLDRDGRPLPNAWMRARRGDEVASATADAGGRIELELALPFAANAALTIGAQGFVTEQVERAPQPGGVRWIGDVRLAYGTTLAGTIVDSSGRPVAGATVHATPVFAMQERDRERAELTGDFGSALALARSEADGSFAFEGLVAGSARVWARTTGRRWAFSAPIPLSAGAARTDVRLVLRDPDLDEWITGVVLDPDGAPVEGARMRWSALAAPAMEGERQDEDATDAEGRFELPALHPGPQRLFVTDPGHAFEPMAVEDALPGTPLVLRLERGELLDVLVLGPGAQPIAGARVRTALVVKGSGKTTPPAVTTDEQGRARLRVPGSDFTVFAQADGHRRAEAGPFARASLPREVILRMRRAPTVNGRVLANGAPLADASVALLLATPHGRVPQVWTGSGEPFLYRVDATPRARATSDAAGRFALPIDADVRNAGSAAWLVRSEAEGRAHALVGPFQLDARAGLDGLKLEHGAGGAIEGVLLPPPGTEPAGYTVRAASADGAVLERELAPDGRFRFDALRPGAWQLAAFEPGTFFGAELSYAAPGESERAFVEVRAGAVTRADLDLTAATRHVLAGRLVLRGAALGVWRAAVTSHGEHVWTALDPEGRFELELEHAGEVFLHLQVENDEDDHLEVIDRVLIAGPRTDWELELAVGRIAGHASGQSLTYEWSRPDAPPYAKARLPLDSDGAFAPTLVPAGPGVLLTGGLSAFGREPEREMHAHGVVVPVGELLRVELP